VGGHTVVRGWAWPVGCQSSSAGQSEGGGVARGCQSGNTGLLFVGVATFLIHPYYRVIRARTEKSVTIRNGVLNISIIDFNVRKQSSPRDTLLSRNRKHVKASL